MSAGYELSAFDVARIESVVRHIVFMPPPRAPRVTLCPPRAAGLPWHLLPDVGTDADDDMAECES